MNSLSIFRAAFIADALSLGPHWIYNQGKLARLYPEGTTQYDDPRAQYHPNRKKGEFTHYGDQMLLLAKAVAATSSWSLPTFAAIWQEGMNGFDGYLDEASKGTLANLASGSQNPASPSDDLAGASRCIPILLSTHTSLEEKVTAAREQTALTHGDSSTIDTAEYFVRVIDAIEQGQTLPEAITQAAQANYSSLPIADWIAIPSGNNRQQLSGRRQFRSSHSSRRYPRRLRL